jgi:CBS domain containing-hemolysin-like protein
MMNLDPSDLTQILILVLLIALSAFFSSSETALTAVNKIRLRSLAEEGVKGAKITYKLIEDPTKMLGAILIGNNVVNISAASIATTLAIRLSTKMGIEKNASIGIGIANGIITILILIFGEITPKSLATLYAEQISLKVGGIIYVLGKILTPVIFIVNKVSLGILLLFRIDTTSRVSQITENELRTIVDVSHEEGVIESEERRMITNVVDFGDSIAKDVMVPHIDMELINVSATYEELLAAFEEEMYSRLPVYEETKDNVIGIINLKDVFFYRGRPEDFHIREYMREPYFTYEFQKTPELLLELRKASVSVAIVLDEYGATAGLITLEDLLEEIVGEIRDEYDDDEVDAIQKIGEDEFIAEGTTRLDEINEVIGLSLESDDYDSIAGHIINLLEHLPKEGEAVEENGVLYTVKEMDKNRIDKVFIKILPPKEKEDGD